VSRYVRSSPHFFRPVGRALVLGVAVLAALAWLLPAPLEPPADPAQAPNPAKSAWFLLWIQELVSHGTAFVYLAVALAALLVALPWLPLPKLAHARWLPRGHRWLSAAVLLVAALVLALTAVGLFLRGPDWRLVSPF
jgi:multisubunit Na+/H+ antiporter MnhB subunit